MGRKDVAAGPYSPTLRELRFSEDHQRSLIWGMFRLDTLVTLLSSVALVWRCVVTSEGEEPDETGDTASRDDLVAIVLDPSLPLHQRIKDRGKS